MFLEILWNFYPIQILESEPHRAREKLIGYKKKLSNSIA